MSSNSNPKFWTNSTHTLKNLQDDKLTKLLMMGYPDRLAFFSDPHLGIEGVEKSIFSNEHLAWK